jgi:hypothetical protein
MFGKEEKLNDKLEKLSPDELQFILNTMCGPHNAILSNKVYGYTPSHLKSKINKILEQKLIEDVLLGD